MLLYVQSDFAPFVAAVTIGLPYRSVGGIQIQLSTKPNVAFLVAGRASIQREMPTDACSCIDPCILVAAQILRMAENSSGHCGSCQHIHTYSECAAIVSKRESTPVVPTSEVSLKRLLESCRCYFDARWRQIGNLPVVAPVAKTITAMDNEHW